MTSNQSIVFKLRAKLGSVMTEALYKKAGKRLNARLSTHKKDVTISWAAINAKNQRDTILFLHGFSDRKENFFFASHFLKNHFSFILPDLPGFGQSTIDPDLTYSLDNYCTWLSQFMGSIGIEPCHLVGSSLGGAVAARLALQFPHQFKSLTLVGSAGFYLPGYRSIYNDVLENRNIFQVNSVAEYDALRKRVFRRPPPLPGVVNDYMAKDTMDNFAWYGKIFNDLMDFRQVRAGQTTLEALSFNRFCKDFTMPVLLLWGRHDSLFPFQTARFISEKMPNARVHIFDDIGHVPQLENPKAFAAALKGFIKSL